MACSDDEEGTLMESVSNYHFEDEKEEPISFSALPILWSESEAVSATIEQIFLRGTMDNGLLKTHKPVIAWKYDLSNVGKPEILVLTKEKVWIKLQKPRKSYEEVCRTILITVHCLHFVRRNPDLSTKSLWDQLGRAFSSYEVKPSENDLVDHMELISEALKRDNSLAKSKILLKFLEEKPKKRKLLDKDVQSTKLSGFIVDDIDVDGVNNGADEGNSDEEEELYDSVCAFCDNGGELLCCEGRCLRSFHATKEAESDCESLGFTKEQVEAMQIFFCDNCKHEQHQCFACGELGSSIKSSGAEVFRCANATCGRFYHPHCVAKLLYCGDEVAAEEQAKRIVAGEGFSCPVHKCCVCGLAEKKKDTEMQFAVCRRCPRSYHRKCLPREIVFENDIKEDFEEGITTKVRAWEGLLHHHILIYCLDHEISELGTPARDHIKFPVTEERKISLEEKKKTHASALPVSTEKFKLKKNGKGLEDSIRGKSAMKEAKQFSYAVKEGQKTKNSEKFVSGWNFLRKVKETGVSRKSLKESIKPVSMEVESSVPDKSEPSLGDRLFAYMIQNPDLVQTQKQDKSNTDLNNIAVVKSTTTKKISNEVPSLDADSERRIRTIMKEVASSVTLDGIIEKFKGPTTHAYSSKSAVDKTITVGKIEGSVEAVRTALQKLEKGCKIDDALAICEPEILQQIFKWQNKLKVYLAPFLHGMRYTSFGRHFTKEEKLEVIVDRLHWYVQDGDMLVDTSCGSNDFSWLMKAKLEETGKKCSYRNYDIIQPKNDFNFEQRDWLTVQTKELPKGLQLIMGLNPPFGVKGALANQFIDKVLEFRPKLVILIVPQETKRLDEKKSPYELIWEDNEFSSGKAFYLPGSVDENDKQLEQWNVTPPPLRLWSHKDWASKHRAIAEKHGHVYKKKESHRGMSDQPLDGHSYHDDGGCDLQKLGSEECHGLSKDQFTETSRKRRHEGGKNQGRGMDRKSPISEMYNGNPHCSSSNLMDDRSSRTSIDSVPSRSLESEERHGHSKNQSSESSRKRKHGEKNHGRVMDQQSPVDGPSGRKPSSDLYNDVPHHSPLPANVMDRRSSLESLPSKSVGTTSHTGIGKHHYRHLEQTMPVSHMQAGTLNSETQGTFKPGSVGTRRMSADMNYGEQFTRHMRGGADRGYASYTIDPESQRDSNLQSQAHLYGQHPVSSTQANYQAGYNPGYSQIGFLSSTYGHFGSLANSSYLRSTSAMQRYAPRLDELNPTRIGTLGSEPPMVSGNGFYTSRPPQPGYRDNSMGYPPGPYQSFPHNYSAGWLNE
ncbi:hypothetical protein SLA2020_243960 [Shorea laevis]